MSQEQQTAMYDQPDSDWLPMACDECGKVMPNFIADNPSTHGCAKSADAETTGETP